MEQKLKPNKYNIEKLSLVACPGCGQYDRRTVTACPTHYDNAIIDMAYYSHYLVGGTWYFIPYKFKEKAGTLLRIEAGMKISGSLDYPEPKRIVSLTDLLTLCRKQGLTEEELAIAFPTKQLTRMRGRVFKKLVKS